MKKTTTKIQENGEVGQARTSSLLSERFWVLRRPVDVHGADFLVQLGDESWRFSDLIPPRLCIVQAKYSQDKKTSHKIPVDYVLQDDGEARRGFFVMLHIGGSDEREFYLLSARDIATDLDLSKDKKTFVISASKAYVTKYKMKSASRSLDIIEAELRYLADMDANGLRIPEYELRRDALSNEWLAPIPNEHGYIPDMVFLTRLILKPILEGAAAEFEKIGDVIKSRDVYELIGHFDELMEILGDSRNASHWFEEETLAVLKTIQTNLPIAADVHQSRLQLLLDEAGERQAFVKLHNKLHEEGEKVIRNIQPKAASSKSGSTVYHDVRLGLVVCVNGSRRGEFSYYVLHGTDAKPQSSSSDERYLEELIPPEHGGAAAVALNRMVVAACGQYFAELFPALDVGALVLPKFSDH